jgi:hypothetical protein
MSKRQNTKKCGEACVDISFNITGFVRVLENLESRGISIFQNPGLESHGKLKFYITLTKYFTYFNLPVITIILIVVI